MRMSMVVVVALIAGAAGGLLSALWWQSEQGSALRVLSTPEQDALKLPFAEGTRVGDLIFVSGQIGAAPGTLELTPGGVQAETRQALDNIRQVLERHGSSMQQVAKCTVFLRDMEEWPAMNEVYTAAFDGHRPARSAFAASGLALDGAVEIECIAAAQQ